MYILSIDIIVSILGILGGGTFNFNLYSVQRTTSRHADRHADRYTVAKGVLDSISHIASCKFVFSMSMSTSHYKQ